MDVGYKLFVKVIQQGWEIYRDITMVCIRVVVCAPCEQDTNKITNDSA